MRIHIHAVHWDQIRRHEREDKNAEGLITRALMNDAPLPWRRVGVDVDTEVDRSWLAAMTRYVRGLPGTGVLTLYVYTTPAFSDVLDLMRGGTQYAKRVFLSPAELAKDRSGVARAGAWLLWARTIDSSLPRALAARVRAHLAARRAIDHTSEESTKRGWAAWDAGCDAILDAARPHVGARFWKRVRMALAKDEWQWSCIFAHAARALRRRHLSPEFEPWCARCSRAQSPLERFKAAFPYVTAAGWRAILVQYIADLDALFARAPPLPYAVVVYRGVKQKEARGAWYTSTSMRRDVAEEFANKESPIVLSIDVPRGTRLLPPCMVSRYPPEVELLLPKKKGAVWAV